VSAAWRRGCSAIRARDRVARNQSHYLFID
jgi:hypothetical protein